MSYYRYKRLQQYINGQPTDVYKKGERADDVDYSTYEACMESSAVTRWVSIPQTVCYDGDLWSMEKEQISYDGGTSWSDTGNSKRASVIEQSSAQCFMNDWRVVPGEYICMMHAKWTKEAEYVSYDGGQTWTATGNIRRGETVIELLSADCGVIYQWIPTGEYICQGYNKYMKEKQVYSTDNGSTWTDTGNRRTGGLVEADSPYCGYEQYIYQWVDVAGEYVCQGTTKYKKQKEQRSRDNGQTWEDTGNTRQGEVIEVNSFDCGYVAYRWVSDTGYVCVGFDKYNKEKEQSTTDGTNWTDTGNTRAGSTLLETDSVDCGYSPSYANQYLTIEALGSGDIFMQKGSYGAYANIQYSKNDGAWTSYTYGTRIPVVNGDKIRWKGEWANKTIYDSSTPTRFVSTTLCKVYGNVLSLILNDNFQTPTDISNYRYAFMGLFENILYSSNVSNVTDASNLVLPDTALPFSCYKDMFNGCTSLTTAPSILPATTLSENCYLDMFYGCTSLTTAPVLPATTLVSGCYMEMFKKCTSLTTAPALPATTLDGNCYDSMFMNCTSLTTAPSILPATTLPFRCCNWMFKGCTNLTTAPVLSATTLGQECCFGMFDGCTSLTTAPALPATTLARKCYYNMFYECSSLTTAPSILPATTLATGCYSFMFYGCTSLTTAPVLPATTLVTECYYCMFENCASLNSVTCCATNRGVMSETCTSNWLYNVAETGTFNKDADAYWPTSDISGIPSGWTTDTCGCEPDYSRVYLTTEALGDGNISLNKYASSGYENKIPLTDIQYSKNNGAWTSYTYDTQIPVVNGDKIRWKATRNDENSYLYYSNFKSTALYKVYGNPISLLVSDNFQNVTDISSYPHAFMSLFRQSYYLTDVSNLSLVATTLAPFCYWDMFYNCSSLTVTPVLPATTLVEGCYSGMFTGCSSLTSAPVLPATTLAKSCYYAMFHSTSLTTAPVLPVTTLAENCYGAMFAGCSSLTTAPVLPATTLAPFCYSGMFEYCSSLTTAPVLPATTLTSKCYDYMFEYCSSLNSVTCYATSESTLDSYRWLYKVATTGTFTKAAGATWRRGENGIPRGWTVVEAS